MSNRYEKYLHMINHLTYTSLHVSKGFVIWKEIEDDYRSDQYLNRVMYYISVYREAAYE